MSTTEGSAAQPHAAELEALMHLLKEEIAAIGDGDLARVTALYPRKKALLEAMEAAAPDMEASARKNAKESRDFREKLTELQMLVRKDAALLERMAEATRDLVSEISRIRDRHGLKGLYGAKGEAQQGAVPPPQRIDQQV